MAEVQAVAAVQADHAAQVDHKAAPDEGLQLWILKNNGK